MDSYTKSAIIFVVSVLLVSAAVSTAVAKVSDEQKTIYQSEPETVYDDGSVDNALLNYLFARQMVNRLRTHVDPNDLQRKQRSYWKQCAFNAVSCFGKK